MKIANICTSPISRYGASVCRFGSLDQKKTETQPNPTEGNRTIGCGCFVWESVWLQVTPLQKIQKLIKDRLQQIATGLLIVFNVYDIYN
jgi:hypothetical protein